MPRKLPIGIQGFEKLRKGGYLYVDKTAYVYRLAQEDTPYFLSRPRRFGKSLLVSTLRAYFEGKRELFQGLALEALEGDGPDAWQARPVFHLEFTGGNYTIEGGLESRLDAMLRRFEDAWGITGEGFSYDDRFRNLLESANAKTGHRCVVLVDEYDKPLLDVIDNPALEERNRATLKAFYSTLKGADEHLRFVFLTGVTKFSKVSIFSDLNQLRDISLNRSYAAICGITEDELLATLDPEIDGLAKCLGMDHDECLDALRAQYDGYRFHQAGPAVYNPFSLLNAFADGELGSYWFSTGTPTFLAKRMRAFDFDPSSLTDGTLACDEDRLMDYRADDPDPVPLLYQTGYLTIRGYDARMREYSLEVPNAEVKWGLLKSLLPEWAPAFGSRRGIDMLSLRRAAEAGDTAGMRRILEAIFASIPYTRDGDPFENYYQAVVWLLFTMLGYYVATEVHQAKGRADCIVETRDHVYVIEFKRGGTAAEALAQIGECGYAAPYAADPRELHLIGCAFDPKTRTLADWEER